jgi:16S rRNA (uracil1498-N3)-methyltransferase
MTIRLHVDVALHAGATLALPAGAARHAQVRRVQPGDALVLFDGRGSDWPAEVLAVGRSSVDVRVGEPVAVDRELGSAVTLALGMPANDRMDDVVEKATELGVARIVPLVCERSVLRLEGERARRRQAHWQAVAVAACEQSGRARVPVVEAVTPFDAYLRAPAGGTRLLLSPGASISALHAAAAGATSFCAVSGPEGGLTPAEEEAAVSAGFAPVGLGPRVLRADTAPLALLAWVALGP